MCVCDLPAVLKTPLLLPAAFSLTNHQEPTKAIGKRHSQSIKIRPSRNQLSVEVQNTREAYWYCGWRKVVFGIVTGAIVLWKRGSSEVTLPVKTLGNVDYAVEAIK